MHINYHKIICCLSGILMTAIVAGCSPGAFLVQPVGSAQGLKETQLHRDDGLWVTDKIAIIDVDGIIANQNESSMFAKGDNPASLFVEKLQAAQHDNKVKAIVLRINSPGGTVAASDIMYHALMEFKAKSKKPVVACMLDVTASGGYYLACGSDGIVAVPSTVTGSIGVIMQTISLAGTMKLIGVKAVAIKSGKLKDMGSPLRDLEADEEKILQDIIMQFYENFLEVVLKGRKDISREKLEQLADG
jgi:protease-4